MFLRRFYSSSNFHSFNRRVVRVPKLVSNARPYFTSSLVLSDDHGPREPRVTPDVKKPKNILMIPEEKEMVTGSEAAELAGVELSEGYLSGPFGTVEHPVLVPSTMGSRFVGCVGGNGKEHEISWHLLKEGRPMMCLECGQVFKYQPIHGSYEKGEHGHGDAHEHGEAHEHGHGHHGLNYGQLIKQGKLKMEQTKSGDFLKMTVIEYQLSELGNAEFSEKVTKLVKENKLNEALKLIFLEKTKVALSQPPASGSHGHHGHPQPAHSH
jgi:hypothetical protein